MSSLVEIALCGEGPTDVAIGRKLVEASGGIVGRDLLGSRARRGKAALDARMPGLKAGARFSPTLVLRDLDFDEPCAGALVARLAPAPSERFCLRIAVRSAEAWLMADAAAFAAAFGVRHGSVPQGPEHLEQPKRVIHELWRDSKKREVRHAVTGIVQPQLVGALLSDFVRDRWEPLRAAGSGRAPSLARALPRIEALCRLSPAV